MNNNIWTNYIHEYVSENGLLDFYTRFLEAFETEWSKLISDYAFNELCQLNNGNRLRPMLVFWGYLLNRNNDSLFDISNQDLHFIMNSCVMIEAIHKMSLLVDDWIDGDIARHGSTTFHVMYGADTAVLLAMNLLLKGFLELSHNLSSIHEKMYKKTMALAVQIAYDMTLGALNEISSKEISFDISKVKEIVDLETSSIIRNGMIIGYAAGEGCDKEIIDLLDDIGYCCGYIFQALNDMEPFGNVDGLVQHKGTLTTDILKNRKNIVVAYIYAWASENEIEKLSNLNDSESMSNYITSLINKYHINKHMITEIANLQLRIRDRIAKIEMKTGHFNWCKHFNDFVEITVAASKKRALG
jgi:Geranylgeranyl pyrophosphate synthase